MSNHVCPQHKNTKVETTAVSGGLTRRGSTTGDQSSAAAAATSTSSCTDDELNADELQWSDSGDRTDELQRSDSDELSLVELCMLKLDRRGE